jgi:hypothetical protein
MLQPGRIGNYDRRRAAERREAGAGLDRAHRAAGDDQEPPETTPPDGAGLGAGAEAAEAGDGAACCWVGAGAACGEVEPDPLDPPD